MHEMSLVRNVVDIVVAQCTEAGVAEVKTVNLVIGEARDIVEDLFEGLFRHFARGTVAEGAHICITRVPLTVRCDACGTVFPLDVCDESTWVCPACGTARSYRVNSGMEFAISSIEVVSNNHADAVGGRDALREADAATAA